MCSRVRRPSGGFSIHATLDADDHLIGVFGVLLEVPLEEHQTVVVGRPVELAAIPKVPWRNEGQPTRGERERERERSFAPVLPFLRAARIASKACC